MHQMIHPLTRAIYDAETDEVVKVTRDGKSGLYTRNGEFISGELKQSVDPEMCRWVASYVEHKNAGVGASARDRAGAFVAMKEEK
ncbi:MAG: hypothetical protein WCL35_06975 [bacterium]